MGAILLMRHGEAVEESLAIRASQRHLTLAGRHQSAAVGRLLLEQAIAIDGIVSSPLMRATQTAELVAAAIGFSGVVEAMPALAPEGDAHAAANQLAAHNGCVLAVGHEPALSAIGALLCRGSPFHPLHKAQVALIQEGRVVWSLGPGDPAPVAAG